MRKTLCFLSFFFCCVIVNAQSDTTVSDCYDAFFASAAKPVSPAKTILTVGTGKSTLTAYIKKYGSAEFGMNPKTGLKDLDGDGKAELIVFTYSGGAHCCDQFAIFKNTAPNNYVLAGKLTGGNTCITDNQFSYSFTEYFGYFFTCYACGMEGDAVAGGTPVQTIDLEYKNGKLQIIPGDEKLKGMITKNVSLIGKLKWDNGGNPDEGGFDDGRRKTLAFNLATYYFAFGRNLTETKALYDKYYKFKDNLKVWSTFVANLNAIKKDNLF